MKRKIFSTMFALVLVVVLLLTTGLITGQSRADSVISTDTFTFVIGLNSNPSTGYCWYADFSERHVKLVDEWFVPDAASLGQVGHGGTHFFLFEKTNRRSAKVTFILKRPWEDTILYKKTFYVR